jgi:hypothetical protein
MVDVDLLLSSGLQNRENLTCLQPEEPHGRNKQTWLVCWYRKVILQESNEQTIAFLNTWIDQGHNGRSKDYLKNPALVYRENERIVQGFDLEKALTGTQVPQERPGATLEVYRQQASALPLSEKQRDLLAHIARYAEARGEKRGNGQIVVEIPSKTLIKWNPRYAPVLRSLIAQKYLKMDRNYGSDTRTCRRYIVKWQKNSDILL